MVFLFITSQLMNIKTAFYFMVFLYLPAKKQQKQRDSLATLIKMIFLRETGLR